MAILNNVQVSINDIPSILQLDVAGQPQDWINYQKAVYYYAKGLVAWDMAAVDLTLHGGKSRMTGEQSTLTMNTIIAIKGKVSNKQFEKMNSVSLTNRTLFRRDQNICGYCGSELTAGKLTRDHIKPTSRDGKNNWMNVITCCAPCNKRKDNKTPEEAHMPLLFVPYVPNKAEYLILQNRNILADQMDFLIKQVPKESRLRLS